MTTEEERQEAITRTGEFVGIGAAGVTAALATNPWLLGLAALFPTLGQIGMRALVRRAEALWEGVKSSAGGDEEAARERLNAATENNPDAQDAVLETLRRMQEALDPDVVFALGRLLWPYATGQRKPDRFFRSMARLLTDLEGAELVALRDMLRAALARTNHHGVHGILSLSAKNRDSEGRSGVALVADMSEEDTTLAFVSDQGRHLFGLLKGVGFGYEEDRWGMAGSDSLAIDEALAQRIVDVLDIPM